MSRPLLSICIPTYNRAELLLQTLDSIVSQAIFLNTNQVEITVSDNCSTDHTSVIVNNMISLYGSKIKYNRNNENLKDRNMLLSLQMGNGDFLKLNNDTLKHNSDSLQQILDTIESHISTKQVLFFTNGILKTNSSSAKDLNDFVNIVSFNSTWIGAFGMWKTDLDVLFDFDRYAKLQLTQTDVLFRTIGLTRKVWINNDKLFLSMEPDKKGGYDLIDVFLDNYTFLLKEAKERNELKNSVYDLETERLLINFLCNWLARIKVMNDKFYFTAKNGFSRINTFYRDRPLLLCRFYCKYIFGLVFIWFKKFINIQ